MNDRFLSVRASLLLARRALERQLALIEARERPDAAAFAEVATHLDDALKELETLAKGGPLRVLPGGGDVSADAEVAGRVPLPDETPVEALGLRSFTISALRAGGILTLGELRATSDRELLRLRQFGRGALAEVRALVPPPQADGP